MAVSKKSKKQFIVAKMEFVKSENGTEGIFICTSTGKDSIPKRFMINEYTIFNLFSFPLFIKATESPLVLECIASINENNFLYDIKLHWIYELYIPTQEDREVTCRIFGKPSDE